MVARVSSCTPRGGGAMKRVVQPAIQGVDSAHDILAAHTSLDKDIRSKWLRVLFVVSFILVFTLRSDAATSVQIAGGSALNYSRSIVRTASGNLYAVIGDYPPNTIRVYESTNGG